MLRRTDRSRIIRRNRNKKTAIENINLSPAARNGGRKEENPWENRTPLIPSLKTKLGQQNNFNLNIKQNIGQKGDLLAEQSQLSWADIKSCRSSMKANHNYFYSLHDR